MRKQSIVIALFAIGFALSITQACKKSEDTPVTPAPSEFIADNNTFKSFQNWHLHATKNGVDPAMLKTAHGGDDSTSVRKIYFPTNNVSSSNGQYPLGTIVSKLTTWQKNGGGSMITAMAKRGNNFDPSGNNWEYFVLAADGSIMVDNGTVMRGANLMNGMCKGCHASAATKDYIFTK